MPARGGGAGLGPRACTQHKQCDAAFFRQQRQPTAGHQIQTAWRAAKLQHHRPHMRTGQNVGGGRQGIGGIGRMEQEQVPGIASQFQEARGRQRAIFQRLVIGPDPEKGFGSSGLDGKTGGKAAGPPIAGKDFMHGAGPEASAQNGIDGGIPQRDGRPVGGKTVAREEMAQIGQFFAFVHVMF